MGQKGTLEPRSWATPKASAVLPVPGAPTMTRSLTGYLLSYVIQSCLQQQSLCADEETRRKYVCTCQQ